MMQPMSPLSWATRWQPTPDGDRIVHIQLTIPTGTGGLIQLKVPPIVSADAKAFADAVLEAATGLVVATRVPT